MKSIKHQQGIHMLYTEALDLDEAIEVFEKQQRRYKQSIAKKGKTTSLKQKMGLAKGQALQKPVTLSDRTVCMANFIRTPSRRRAYPVKPRVIWTKDQLLEAYKTGSFKPGELATRANVSIPQIKYWIWSDYIPDPWWCSTNHPRQQITGRREYCPKCGTYWKKHYNIEE